MHDLSCSSECDMLAFMVPIQYLRDYSTCGCIMNGVGDEKNQVYSVVGVKENVSE